MAQQHRAASYMFAGTCKKFGHYALFDRDWAARRGNTLQVSRVDDPSLNMSSYVENVADHILENAADAQPITIVGHSWGGIVAKRVALKLVESGVDANNIRLVTIGTPVWPNLKNFDVFDRAMQLGKLGLSVPHWAHLWRSFMDGSISDGVLTAIRAAQVSYPDIDKDVAARGIPTMHLRGSRDRLLDRGDFYSAAEQAGATAVEIPGANHFSPLDDYYDPAIINEIDAWLDTFDQILELTPAIGAETEPLLQPLSLQRG